MKTTARAWWFSVLAALSALMLGCSSEIERAPGPTDQDEVMEKTMGAAGPPGMQDMYQMYQQGEMDPKKMEEMQRNMFPQGYPMDQQGNQ